MLYDNVMMTSSPLLKWIWKYLGSEYDEFPASIAIEIVRSEELMRGREVRLEKRSKGSC